MPEKNKKKKDRLKPAHQYDTINTSLAIIVQDLQMIERRLSPALPTNLAVAEDLGLSLDTMHEYLKQREVLDFISAMQRASRRITRLLGSISTAE
jgi:hypothetical protein